jgi:hypothetical protein
MSSTLERLRRLHGLREQRTRSEPAPPEPPARAAPTAPPHPPHEAVPSHGSPLRLEDLVPGQVIENRGGTCYLSTQYYTLDQPRGAGTLQKLLEHSPTALHPFHPQFNLHANTDFRTAAFIDTETTGLGAGAGVYAFMVGIGTFETLSIDNRQTSTTVPNHASSSLHSELRTPNSELRTQNSKLPTHFVVRQLFMRHPGEECALLVALSELLADHELTVTFNGRTFDLPLLRVRFQQNRRWLPERHRDAPLLHESRAHLDLLHPARRLWRRRLESCRLIHLEKAVLGVERTEEDVPSHLIPMLYTEYARNADARQMPGIFYHNREDIVSMVGLAERLYDAFRTDQLEREEPAQARLPMLDWLSLGCCYQNKGDWPRAERAFVWALDAPARGARDAEGRREAFRRLGELQKRQGRWQDAAATWQRWLSSVAGIDPTPYVELAKYCEWQTKDFEQAAMWTGWALHNLCTAPNAGRLAGQIAELKHRLARLERKQRGIDA